MQLYINRVKSYLNAQKQFSNSCSKQEIYSLKESMGRILSQQNLYIKKNDILNDITKAEFKVFSQWGDDGIINFLINYLDIPNKNFVEFGVENYTECNTRFLLVNDNWSGLIMDGSEANMKMIQSESIYWRFDLKSVATFVTAENINQLLQKNNFTGELGLLHIDIDGNDYWIWKSIEVVNPIIVIVEYNSIFGFENSWTVPYDAEFVRGKKHYSNLYYGTSLLSLYDLAVTKGYSFIGCNSNGNNAYFIRNDKLKSLQVKSPECGYVLSKFAESRDKDGNLTFLRNNARLELLRGMKVYNTRKKIIEEL
jgi:hypothetical protein